MPQPTVGSKYEARTDWPRPFGVCVLVSPTRRKRSAKDELLVTQPCEKARERQLKAQVDLPCRQGLTQRDPGAKNLEKVSSRTTRPSMSRLRNDLTPAYSLKGLRMASMSSSAGLPVGGGRGYLAWPAVRSARLGV